jgi:diketogulonate reductase-like aldo/keto reductase
MHTVAANGAKIPAIGFGTYGMDRRDMLRMIPAALKGGFRHIDTARSTVTRRKWVSALVLPAFRARISS